MRRRGPVEADRRLEDRTATATALRCQRCQTRQQWGWMTPTDCCGWRLCASDDVAGIGAVYAGGGDTALALVNDGNKKESTAGPRMEVDDGGPRSGTARAGGVLNLVIAQDDAKCGREREDGSGIRAVAGVMLIGVVDFGDKRSEL